jgi:hypothetical protein
MPFYYGHKDQAPNQHTWYARDPARTSRSSNLRFREPEGLAARAGHGTQRSIDGVLCRPGIGGIVNWAVR